jgi:amino acid adenylation domain-containing protein
VVLTTADHVDSVPKDATPTTLLDQPLPAAAASPLAASPDDLAYLVATSGTTGTPRIVEVPHRAIANHACAIKNAFGLQPGDRVLQLASPGFDVQLEEVLPTLVAGATLVVPDRSGLLGLDELISTVERQAVTVLNLPSPLWRDWLLAIDARLVGVPASLRLLVVGSDRVLPEDLLSWSALTGARPRLVQAYGVTEATITSLLHVVAEDAGPEEATVIGRPLRNVEAHVLNPRGAQQPIGVPGELYLGGVALARGYHDDPEATQAAFGPHTFAPKTRLYRTGDRVVRRPDGALRFLGRLDDQVKVRGVRIEPEEVAAHLRAHPGVREAVAALRSGALAAWVVPACDPAPAAHSLHAYMAERLPAAAVPATYTLLPALPRTAHGKLDWSALPPPQAAPVGPATSPLTGTEEAVAAVWRDVLGREAVGRDDSFFDLGGHSLLLVRAHVRLAAALAPGLTVLDLFRHPTVRTLAGWIEELAS